MCKTMGNSSEGISWSHFEISTFKQGIYEPRACNSECFHAVCFLLFLVSPCATVHGGIRCFHANAWANSVSSMCIRTSMKSTHSMNPVNRFHQTSLWYACPLFQHVFCSVYTASCHCSLAACLLQWCMCRYMLCVHCFPLHIMWLFSPVSEDISFEWLRVFILRINACAASVCAYSCWMEGSMSNHQNYVTFATSRFSSFFNLPSFFVAASSQIHVQGDAGKANALPALHHSSSSWGVLVQMWKLVSPLDGHGCRVLGRHILIQHYVDSCFMLGFCVWCWF